MGSIKVILFCLLSIIIGTYTLGIKSAENTSFQASVDRANQIQAEEIAKTGVQIALDELACNPYIRTLQSKTYIYTKVVLGDTVTYNIDPNSDVDKATVTVVAKYNGVTTKMKAKVSIKANPNPSNGLNRGRWGIDRIYVYPS
ncbi:MAG: hypothetical protein HY088_04915 [Ignavibacteriales bacterium]|nr:hypothetical protein [Ignavibacteriales bacterium]